MTADRTVRTIALLILMAAATAMCLEIAFLAQDMRLQLVPQAEEVVAQASTTVTKADAAVVVQESYWNEELSETKKATSDLHDLLIHTDISLNGRHGDGGILGDVHAQIIPRVASTLDTGNAVLRDVDVRSGAVLDSANISVSRLVPLEDALTKRVADPQYDAILADAAASMHNLTGMTADGKHIGDDTAAFVHRELAPVRGTWNVLKSFLFEIAGPAASVASVIR